MLSMERHHAIENGWDGIGYHWIIFQSGRIYEGRGWDRVGAHAGKTANRSMYGVCFVIDGDLELPSPEAITSFRLLVAEGLRTGRVTRDYRITGHRDHMARDCPGDLVYEMLPLLRHDAVKLPPYKPGVVLPPRPVPVAPPMNLELIEVPTAQHVDEFVRRNGWSDIEALVGVQLTERMVRGMLRATYNEGLKLLGDALSDWIRKKR